MPRGYSVYDSANLQGRLWTPAVLRPAAWFDPEDLSTITIATGVSELRDKSGNGRHLSQSTGSSQPILTANALNNRAGITFDSTDDYMVSASEWWLTAINAGAFSVFQILKTSAGAFGSLANSSTAAGLIPRHYFTNNALSYNTLNTVSITAVLNEPTLLQYKHDGVTTAAIRRDGGTETTATVTATAPSGGYFGLNGPNRFEGVFGEILIFNYAISDPERLDIEGYLAWKWDTLNRLPADHPYTNRPPMNGD